jgi:pyrroline-5-carboxylate reductase
LASRRVLLIDASRSTGQLAWQTDLTPPRSIKMVRSPSGTMAVALEMFAQLGFDELIMAACKAAAQHTEQLANQY